MIREMIRNALNLCSADFSESILELPSLWCEVVDWLVGPKRHVQTVDEHKGSKQNSKYIHVHIYNLLCTDPEK